jgi:hypothetical protein
MRMEPAAHVASRSPAKPKKAHAVATAESAGETRVTVEPAPEEPKTAASEPVHKPDVKGKPATTTAAFVGDYSGEDVAVYHIENLPDRTEKDPKARLEVTSSSDSALAFELVDSSNGNEICTLNGALSDGAVTIAKGQKCFEQNSEDASTAATVLTGTASIEQSRLLFDLDMSFAMEVAGKKLGGSLSYHFDGKRK